MPESHHLNASRPFRIVARAIPSTFIALVSIAAFLCTPQFAQAQQPPPRPHIFAIAKVQVFASDLRASSDFYSKILGLAPPADSNNPRLLFPVNAVQSIGLSQVPNPAPADLIEEITFATDDIPALRRYLAFHKITTTEAPQKSGAPASLLVSDPEGHHLAFIAWNKATQGTAAALSAGQQIIHSGFVVHDRPAEDHFYGDILGFRLYWHGGMTETETNWVDMQVPDGTDWVEYMLNIPADASHHTLGVMNHIAIGVLDIHVAYDKILASGWKPGEQPKFGRDGKRQLNLYDPDDTRVEFMEFAPTGKTCCSPYTGPHPGPAALRPASPDAPQRKYKTNDQPNNQTNDKTNDQPSAPPQPQL